MAYRFNYSLRKSWNSLNLIGKRIRLNHNQSSNALLVPKKNPFILTSTPSYVFETISTRTLLNTELPATKKSYFEIYDQIPWLDINLPALPDVSMYDPLPLLQNEITDHTTNSTPMLCKGGLLRIRRKKMNKHRYKKRKKRDRAKTRKLLIQRERVRRRKRANKKITLIKKVEEMLENNPKSTYHLRPYVVHRLTKW